MEAAQRLGYKPNPVATNLKYGHTNTVGVIVPEMVTPFASRVIRGIQEILYANHIKVIVAESGEDAAQERENLQLMGAIHGRRHHRLHVRLQAEP